MHKLHCALKKKTRNKANFDSLKKQDVIFCNFLFFFKHDSAVQRKQEPFSRHEIALIISYKNTTVKLQLYRTFIFHIGQHVYIIYCTYIGQLFVAIHLNVHSIGILSPVQPIPNGVYCHPNRNLDLQGGFNDPMGACLHQLCSKDEYHQMYTPFGLILLTQFTRGRQHNNLGSTIVGVNVPVCYTVKCAFQASQCFHNNHIITHNLNPKMTTPENSSCM